MEPGIITNSRHRHAGCIRQAATRASPLFGGAERRISWQCFGKAGFMLQDDSFAVEPAVVARKPRFELRPESAPEARSISRQSKIGLNAANFFLAEITGVVLPFLVHIFRAAVGPRTRSAMRSAWPDSACYCSKRRRGSSSIVSGVAERLWPRRRSRLGSATGFCRLSSRRLVGSIHYYSPLARRRHFFCRSWAPLLWDSWATRV